MDVVSFETAKRLREAGFPCPKYIELGFGYTETGALYTISDYKIPPSGLDGMVFAPSATDIMRQLPNVQFCYDGLCFGFPGGLYSTGNPAEILAKKYLNSIKDQP